jgi:hypothetical protein
MGISRHDKTPSLRHALLHLTLAVLALVWIMTGSNPARANVMTQEDVKTYEVWRKRLYDSGQDLVETARSMPGPDLAPAHCLIQLFQDIRRVRDNSIRLLDDIYVSFQMRDKTDEVVSLRYLNLAIQWLKQNLQTGRTQINEVMTSCTAYPVVRDKGEKLLQIYSELNTDLDKLADRLPQEATQVPGPVAQ